MRILVTGRSGQLAVALAERATERPEMELIFLGRPELDMENTASIGEQIDALRPDLVINAAAYTAVDRAEQERELAFAINATAPAAMAAAVVVSN